MTILTKEKPKRADFSRNDDWIYFMRHIAEWGWLHALVRLGEDCLVVADKDFLTRADKLSDNYKCDFSTVAALGARELNKYKSILVFLQNDELQFIENLRSTYPEVNVVSGCHEFSQVNHERAARLEVIRSAPKATKHGPVVFLSMPNSGAEFLTENLGKNCSLKSWEYIGRPFVSLTKIYHGIDFFEIIKNTENRYKSDDGIAYLFQTDVLEAFFENTDLTFQGFVDWLKVQGASVIILRRSDLFRQAVISGLLRSTYNRSIWTMRKRPNFEFKLRTADVQNVADALLRTIAGEQLLNDFTSKLENVLELQLDDAVLNIEAAIQKVAVHSSLSLSDELEVLDYENNFWHKPEMEKVQVSLRRTLIDRFGLHVDALRS